MLGGSGTGAPAPTLAPLHPAPSTAPSTSHGMLPQDSRANPDTPLQRRRTNPLGELISTETRYVHELGITLHRVAAAWNPRDLPAKDVDAMFRALHTVYRTNSEFLRALQEIGPNPSSPKGLGNLLMHWIDTLQAPYSHYIDVYTPHLDTRPDIAHHARLQSVLQNANRQIPRNDYPNGWTLDRFFELPILRLVFYKKLYGRLLRNAQPGRSDHTLLLTANEKLDVLNQRAQRQKVSLGSMPSDQKALASTSSPLPTDPRLMSPVSPVKGRALVPPHEGAAPAWTQSALSITSSITSQSLDQMQTRIDSTHTVDVFTMEPKNCRLQLVLPGLSFERALRLTDGARLEILPAQGKPQMIQHARMILLTDLILVAEDVAPSAPGAPDIKLIFPPLSGRFIDAFDDTRWGPACVRLSIMNRVSMVMHLASTGRKHEWLQALSACKSFSGHLRPQQNQSLSPSKSAPQIAAPTPSPITSRPPTRSQTPTQPSKVLAPLSSLARPPLPLVPSSQSGRPAQAAQPAAPSMARPPILPDALVPGTLSAQSTRHEPSPAPSLVHSGSGVAAKPAPPLSAPSAVPVSSASSPPTPSASFPPAAQNVRTGQESTVSRPSIGAPFTLGQNKAVRPPALPPLLPHNITNAHLPAVLPAEQDGSFISPPLSPELPTRANSLASQDSFPRIPRRLDTPDSMLQRPDDAPRPGGSTAMSFGSASEKAMGSMIPQSPGPEQRRSPLFVRNPIRTATVPMPAASASASSTPPQPSRALSRSASQSQLGEHIPSNGAVLPSQMNRDKPQRNSNEWMHEPDDEDNDNDMSTTRRMRAHEAQSFNLCAQMRCKVFLKHSYAQWRALGSARLRLYHLRPSNTNQLVVENDKKTIISSIILPIAVQRVGRTGLAVELSDYGRLTGVVYMLHMRSEESANGLHQQLLTGSTRSPVSSPQLS